MNQARTVGGHVFVVYYSYTDVVCASSWTCLNNQNILKLSVLRNDVKHATVKNMQMYFIEYFIKIEYIRKPNEFSKRGILTPHRIFLYISLLRSMNTIHLHIEFQILFKSNS